VQQNQGDEEDTGRMGHGSPFTARETTTTAHCSGQVVSAGQSSHSIGRIRALSGESRLKGKWNVAVNERFDAMTAVITGGASGIGLAVASRIIAEGGQATLWDVNQAKLDSAQAKFGPKARAKRVDITNPEEVERAAKDAEGAMGHIDILVQRRRGGVERRCRGLPTRRMEASFRRQHQRSLLLQSVRRAADESPRVWPHRQHLVSGR
jgi:hypothetical protein